MFGRKSKHELIWWLDPTQCSVSQSASAWDTITTASPLREVRKELERRRICANWMFLTFPLNREEMKSLQAALQKQLDEATEQAEKQQATVSRSPQSSSPRLHLSPLTSPLSPVTRACGRLSPISLPSSHLSWLAPSLPPLNNQSGRVRELGGTQK